MASLLPKIALLIMSLALVLASLEFGLRSLGRARPEPLPFRPPPDPALQGLPRLKGILALAKPNTRGVFKGVLHRTNSAGFRGPEYVVPKPPAVFRTVIIGDSFTMGSGVDEDDTYAKQLELRLSNTDPLQTHEVLNLGIGGLNLRNSVARLKSIGLRFDPDLIVYGWTHNDLEGLPSYRSSRGKRRPGHSRLYVVRWLTPRWRVIRHLVYPSPGSGPYELDDNYFRNPGAWSEFLRDLDELAHTVERARVCGVVLLHTHLVSLHWLHPFRRYGRVVQAAAEERGLFVVPSFPQFRGRDPRSLWVNPRDLHPNAAGHRILAAVLHSGLTELPSRCGVKSDSASEDNLQ